MRVRGHPTPGYWTEGAVRVAEGVVRVEHTWRPWLARGPAISLPVAHKPTPGPAATR